MVQDLRHGWSALRSTERSLDYRQSIFIWPEEGRWTYYLTGSHRNLGALRIPGVGARI